MIFATSGAVITNLVPENQGAMIGKQTGFTEF
jgi:hypothetical protein